MSRYEPRVAQVLPSEGPAVLIRCTLCLAACVVCLESLSATVILTADFATLVTEAGVIVHGRVVDVRLAGEDVNGRRNLL